MKSTILGLSLLLLGNYAFAQDKAAAENLVGAGVEYHDKGDFKAALSKYDEALKLDKDNLLALTEKAITLTTMERFDEAIEVCKLAIATHPHEDNLAVVYVNYGNATDGLNKTEDAIALYDEGLKEFSDYFFLHFNKGVSLLKLDRKEEANLCFQQSVARNPRHTGSHSLIGILESDHNSNITALLAVSRALILDPKGEKAKYNLPLLQKIMQGNVEITGKKSVTLNINQELLNAVNDTTKRENNFGIIELTLSMDAALDAEKKNRKKSEVEKFIRKFETVCKSMKELKASNTGFFWNYYAPYFIDMLDKNLIETFAHIAYASLEDKDILKWLVSHEKDVLRFFKWDKEFEWYQK